MYQNDFEEERYDTNLPTPPGGWIGRIFILFFEGFRRSTRRSVENRARRWMYWNVPFLRTFMRFRNAGPLGRVGIVIQLIISVGLMVVVALVLLNVVQTTDLLQAVLPR